MRLNSLITDYHVTTVTAETFSNGNRHPAVLGKREQTRHEPFKGFRLGWRSITLNEQSRQTTAGSGWQQLKERRYLLKKNKKKKQRAECQVDAKQVRLDKRQRKAR